MRKWRCAAALVVTAALAVCWVSWPEGMRLPGARVKERELVRVWVAGSVGGGEAWLTQVLRRFERAHPGVMTYLRKVSASELTAENAVLPDVMLYLPGDRVEGDRFRVIEEPEIVRSELLESGRKDGRLIGLPVCWGGYVLAIDGRLEPETAVTPAPTTLLGKPAPAKEAALPTEAPGYPLENAMQQSVPLLCAPGVPMETLRMLLGNDADRLMGAAEAVDQQTVYARFLAGQCATAVLTTGQAAAMDSRIAAGNAPPCRYMTPDAIVTDQVWLASVTDQACPMAAELLAWLMSADMQRLLAGQSLQTVRNDLFLYADGWRAEIANAARRKMVVAKAYE